MKKGHYEECKNCGKKYYYESTGNMWPGGKERKFASCPYCKVDGPSEVTSGFINSYKLDKDEKPVR